MNKQKNKLMVLTPKELEKRKKEEYISRINQLLYDNYLGKDVIILENKPIGVTTHRIDTNHHFTKEELDYIIKGKILIDFEKHGWQIEVHDNTLIFHKRNIIKGEIK